MKSVAERPVFATEQAAPMRGIADLRGFVDLVSARGVRQLVATASVLAGYSNLSRPDLEATPPADAGAEGYNSPDGERHTLRSRDDHVRATDGSMQPCLEEGTCCSSTGRIRGARARRRLTRSKKPARRSGRDGARECAAMGPREPTDRSNPHPTSAARHPRPQRVADRIMLRRGGSAVADWGDLRS